MQKKKKKEKRRRENVSVNNRKFSSSFRNQDSLAPYQMEAKMPKKKSHFFFLFLLICLINEKEEKYSKTFDFLKKKSAGTGILFNPRDTLDPAL